MPLKSDMPLKSVNGKTRIMLALWLNRIVVLNYSCYRSMLLEHSWFLYSSFFSRFGSRGGSLFCSSYCTEVKTKRRPPLSLFIPLFRKRRRQKDANISTKGEVLLHGGLRRDCIMSDSTYVLLILNSKMFKWSFKNWKTAEIQQFLHFSMTPNQDLSMKFTLCEPKQLNNGGGPKIAREL